MYRRCMIATALVLSLNLACSNTYREARNDVMAARRWKPRNLPAELQAWKAHREQTTQPADSTPPFKVVASPPAGLVEYTLAALQHNPAIQSSLAGVEAKLERIPQVTSLDDPMLRLVTRPEPIQTAAGDIVFTLGASQKIPLPKKLELRGRMAAEEVREAIERLNAQRLQTIADVQHAYYRIYVSDRAIEITKQNAALLHELERVASAQFEVGKTDQQDVLRIQTEQSQLDDDLNRYQGQRTSAVAAINQLMDRPTTTEIATLPQVDPSVVKAKVVTLIGIGVQSNPELAALQHRLDRDHLASKLADLAYVPDLTLGFEWNHVDPRQPFVPQVNPQTRVIPPYNDASAHGDDNWALTIGLNLPIWAQRNEAQKREARKRIEATRDEGRSLRRLIEFRIHDAWARIETSQTSIELLDSSIIPQARQSYEASLLAYQEGTEKFITVIDNWRKLLMFELMKHRNTAALETAFADLQREIGASLVSPAESESEVSR